MRFNGYLRRAGQISPLITARMSGPPQGEFWSSPAFSRPAMYLMHGHMPNSQVTPGHAAGKAFTGLVTRPKIRASRGIPRRVKTRNGIPAHADHLSLGIRHQARRGSAAEAQSRREEGRTVDRAEISIRFMREITAIEARPWRRAASEIRILAAYRMMVEARQGCFEICRLDIEQPREFGQGFRAGDPVRHRRSGGRSVE